MQRDQRIKQARQTVSICEVGYYNSAEGTRINLGDELARAKAGTVIYSPENSPKAQEATATHQTRFEVRNETTFEALARLSKAGTGREHVACLNFASAKNPGGGFLNGSLAQEEALALASGLYPCLLQAPMYYERNRAHRSALYLDLVIYSPLVPFFRDDGGRLLEKLVLASVITAPAPNAGAIAKNEPANLKHIESALRRRTELILQIASSHAVDHLVLGAWGCGVFRNDPRQVAQCFHQYLKPGAPFAGYFKQVTFGVFDRSEGTGIYRAFKEQFERTSG